jgi:DNA processing protein
MLEQLDSQTRDSVRDEATRLADRGVTAILRGSTKYPKLLNFLDNAPPAFFALGNTSLLSEPSIGACGSRNASDEGLGAAQACGHIVATRGIVSVSGYARGVDMAVHASTLEHGGSTIIVLPEEYRNSKSSVARLIQSGKLAEHWCSLSSPPLNRGRPAGR